MGSGNPAGIIARIDRYIRSESPERIREIALQSIDDGHVDEIDDWIIAGLLEHYSSKITSLATYVYFGSVVGQNAFKEWARSTLRRGAHTFLFKSQHWRSRRSIDPYLLTCLNRLADRLKSDADAQKKVSVPVCSACRVLNGMKEFLHCGDKLLRCANCEQEIERLGDLKEPTDRERHELALRSVFAAHSRKGYRCPKCEMFVPESHIKEYKVSCPYTCGWFGTVNEMDPMSHPLGLSSDCTVSLNRMIGDNESMEWQSCFNANEATADVRLQVSQQCRMEHDKLAEVIELQMARVMEEDPRKAIKKQLMYQAYKNMLDKHPEDMIRYLAHRKSIGDMPIQSQLFQEFIRLVRNALPFTIRRFGYDIEIYSLLDPGLDLFLGVSEFEAKVGDGGTVPNRTEETYIGGREYQDHGPCFIGWLCDIVDHNGESLMDHVVRYTFSHIKLRGVRQGSRVRVTHMRIPSHYEMNGMVQLQRIRRRIVDSVYQRLHGKRREIKKRNEMDKAVP